MDNNIKIRKNLSVDYKTDNGQKGTIVYDYLAMDVSHGVTEQQHIEKSVQNHVNRFRDKDKKSTVTEVKY